MAKEKNTDGQEISALSFDVSEKPKGNYVPEGYDSAEQFLQEMRDDYELDFEYDRENRLEAIDDKQFTAGEQWDKDVLEYRQGLPSLTINTVPQFIAQLVGDWRQNRRSVKVLPSEDGDINVASVRGDLVRAIETKSRANRVYDTTFESVCQCGDGAFRVSVEYAKDDVFDQEIFVRPIDDALSVVWDRMSVDPTGRDARHCFVDDMIPIREFKSKFGDEADQSSFTQQELGKLRATGWLTTEEARVTEYWQMIEKTRLLGLFEDGSIHVLEGDMLTEIIQQHGMPVKTRLGPCSYARMHICTGNKILAGPYEYKLNRLPIIRMIGRVVNVAGRRVRYGLVRFMKDAVRLRNFWRSVAAEQLGYAPKAQWIAVEGAVEGREDEFRKAHLSRDPLLLINEDFIIDQDIKRIDPPEPQMALLNEAQVNSQDMKDVTGIHDASLGIKSNETSGKAILARQREGDTASFTYYDNGDASILEGGDVINQLIGQIYDGTRIIRVIGEDEAIKFVNINDPNDPRSPNIATGNYDVALSTGASYTTRRIEAAEAMMNAVQVYPEIMQIAGDLVVKAQDWPGAEDLAERLRKTIPPQLLTPEEQQESGMQQQQGVPPEAMAQVQDQMVKLQDKLMELDQKNKELTVVNKDKTEENKIAWYKAETDRIKALTDHEVDANEMEFKAVAKLLDANENEAQRAHEQVMTLKDQDHKEKESTQNREHTATEAEKNRKAATTAKPKPKS